MNINENIYLNANITVQSGLTEVQALTLNCSIDKQSMNVNFNINTIDKDLVVANSVVIQTQIDEFIEALRTRLLECGFNYTL